MSNGMSTGFVSCAMWSGAMMAALLCRTSRRPNRSTVAAMRCSTDATSPASNSIASAASPMSAATFSASSPLTSPTVTCAPSSASRRAVAAPIPDPPPVMTATLPSKRLMLAMSVSSSGSADVAGDCTDDGVGSARRLDSLRGDDVSAGHLDVEVAVDQRGLALGEVQRRGEATERLVLQGVQALLDGVGGDGALRRGVDGGLEELAGRPGAGRDLTLAVADGGRVLRLGRLVLLRRGHRRVGEREVALGRDGAVDGRLLGPSLRDGSARGEQRSGDALCAARLRDVEGDRGGAADLEARDVRLLE